jgi:predicted lipase
MTNTQGYVARDDNKRELIVALRGSASLQDAILDMQILLVPLLFPGVTLPKRVLVHSGFLVAWDSVALEVIALLKQQLARHHGYTIVTTGHSLGGALAAIASVCLQQICKSSSVKLYSYGAPRAGVCFPQEGAQCRASLTRILP